jgi:hypothetical protein
MSIASLVVASIVGAANADIGVTRFRYTVPFGTAAATRFDVTLPAPGRGNAYSNLVLRRPTLGGTLAPAAAVPANGGLVANISGRVNGNNANPFFTIARNNSVDVYTRTILNGNITLATRVDFFNGGVAAIAADAAPRRQANVRNLPSRSADGTAELILDMETAESVSILSVARGYSYSAVEEYLSTMLAGLGDVPGEPLLNPIDYFPGLLVVYSEPNFTIGAGQTVIDLGGELGPDEAVFVFGTFGTGTAARAFGALLAAPAAPPPCLGDSDGNGTVNFADITSTLTNFGAIHDPGSQGPGDANDDGVVNFVDITSILSNYGATCS